MAERDPAAILAEAQVLRLRMPPVLLFGRGAVAQVPALLEELGCCRPLLVSDPGVVATGLPARLAAAWGGQGLAEDGSEVPVWDGVTSKAFETEPEACRDAALAGAHDSLVALGGGTVLDVAKVAALLVTNGGRTADYYGFDAARKPPLPLILVPTTAGGGGEVSSHAVILGPTERKKEVVSGIHVQARATVVDPETTVTLPPQYTAYAGLDGLVHAVESFWARRANPFSDAVVRVALPRLAAGLPASVTDGGDLDAREQLSQGGLYSGLAMANTNAGAMHALGYPLTSDFDIPHGLANALMGPPVLRRVAAALPAKAAELARLLGVADGASDGASSAEPGAQLTAWWQDLMQRLDLPLGLRHHGVQKGDLDRLGKFAAEFGPVLENTPVRFSVPDLTEMYREAF